MGVDHERRQQLAVTSLQGYASGPDAPIRAEADALERLNSARWAILVEGISDQIALETLAGRQGRNLQDEEVVIVPMGGAHAIARYVALLGPGGADLKLAGLCDVAEEPFYRRALAAGDVGTRGFFVCVNDLEEELIRACADLPGLLDSQGDLGSFRTLQKQAEWRDREFQDQMHRWLRAGARRNLRYAHLITDSVQLDTAPQPLVNVLNSTLT